ncbi:pickpocket 28 [Carabus blaptoides fortunei]
MSTENQVSSVFNTNSVIVYVHDKAAYAEDSAFFATIGPGREISMKISAEVFQADPELKQINIKARKCLLDGEGSRVLKQHYSSANCMHLCKRNVMGNLCGCVSHFFPDLDPNSMADLSCDCLPSCSGVKYGGALETLFYQTSKQREKSRKLRREENSIEEKNNILMIIHKREEEANKDMEKLERRIQQIKKREGKKKKNIILKGPELNLGDANLRETVENFIKAHLKAQVEIIQAFTTGRDNTIFVAEVRHDNEGGNNEK